LKTASPTPPFGGRGCFDRVAVLCDRIVMPDLNCGFAVWNDHSVTVAEDLPGIGFTYINAHDEQGTRFYVVPCPSERPNNAQLHG
jgi:hypothetical protein